MSKSSSKKREYVSSPQSECTTSLGKVLLTFTGDNHVYVDGNYRGAEPIVIRGVPVKFSAHLHTYDQGASWQLTRSQHNPDRVEHTALHAFRVDKHEDASPAIRKTLTDKVIGEVAEWLKRNGATLINAGEYVATSNELLRAEEEIAKLREKLEEQTAIATRLDSKLVRLWQSGADAALSAEVAQTIMPSTSSQVGK